METFKADNGEPYCSLRLGGCADMWGGHRDSTAKCSLKYGLTEYTRETFGFSKWLLKYWNLPEKKVTAMFRGVFGIDSDTPKFYFFHGFWRNMLTMFCGTLVGKQWSSLYTESIINKLQRSRLDNRQTRPQGWERTPRDEYDVLRTEISWGPTPRRMTDIRTGAR